MIKRYIAAILFLICALSVSAQYYMNVFRNDGGRVLYNIASIDSVSVQQTDESSMYQLVIYADYGHNPVYFNTGLIDSITYKPIDHGNLDAIYSVRVVSDDIIAFESNGWATVKIRTTPTDLLVNNADHAQIRISDPSGTPDDRFELGEKEFSVSDSIWQIKIRLKSSAGTEGKCAVSVIYDDIIAVSQTFTVKKVSFKMNSVKVYSNLTMSFDSKSNTYSYCLPTTTDFSAQKFMFSHSGDKVTVGDSLLVSGTYNTLNVSQPLTVSVWKYDLHKDYTIKLTNTGLPVVRIDTKGQSVTRRDTWVPGATIRIELPDGTVDYEGTLSLKGRGNGTWSETNKKPYALKLNNKAKILGMDKSKRWCLLANYKDRTLLRNDAALWLSRHTDMPYTVKGRYVELVWNGKHMGNYYLCQQIRIEDGRVEIADPDLNDPANGGMLVVIDDFLGYSSSDRYDKSPMVGFRSTGSNNRYKLPYVLKDPEEDENGNLLTSSSATYQYLFNYVKNMEDAIYGLKTNPNSNWQQYLDIDRAIDFVLIQEMTMNHDSYNTWPNAGPKSTYLYKDAGGKLCYGPVWDFDYHTFTLYNDAAYSSPGSGENPRIQQWEILKMDNKGNNKYYFSDLVKYDSEFKARLLERWNEYKYVWRDSLPIYIDMMADSIRVSESYNDAVWVENKSLANYRQNGDYNLSFQEAVDAMKTAFRKRWNWIDQNLPNLCK